MAVHGPCMTPFELATAEAGSWYLTPEHGTSPYRIETMGLL